MDYENYFGKILKFSIFIIVSYLIFETHLLEQFLCIFIFFSSFIAYAMVEAP